MRSVIADTYGGPEALRIVDAPAPSPDADQVLVRVAASSVNPLDTHELTGRPYLVRIARGLRTPKPSNRALGSDIAGVGVAALTALQGLRRGGLTGPVSWAPGEVEPMRPRATSTSSRGSALMTSSTTRPSR